MVLPETGESAMSSKKQPVVSTEPASIQDAAYRFALTGETSRNLAQYVLGVCPDFLDNVPSEIHSQLYTGFQIRKHEITEPVHYKMGEGGVFIPLSEKPAADAQGIVVMSINAAMSYSQQEFGKLKEKDPALHSIIKPMRDGFSSYASNNLKALKAAIRAVLNAGKPRERSANKGFREAMTDAFATLDKRVKTARDRGDTEADPLKYRLAVDNFWKTYNA
jgi:hypothetical protein